MMRRHRCGFVLCAAAMLVGCAKHGETPGAGAPRSGAQAAAPTGGANAPGGGPGGAAGARRAAQFPVEVVAVETRDVEYRITAVGSVEAFEIVQVTSRVQGVVEAVRFAEGNRVAKDSVLVEIEPERFRLAVASARASLEKADAARAEADAGVKRREGANARNTGVIPAEEIETWRTRARSAVAEVQLAQAALQQAELNLHDAYVRAPVGGIIQTRSVQTGEFVQPGTPLASLLRRDPLLLRFAVPEQDAGQIAVGQRATFRVHESAGEFTARITHIAAAADATSRMVPVTAHVDPAAGRTGPRPGAFAEVSVPVGSASHAPVIPETAIRPSERGFLAFVIQGGKARERILQLGMRTSDGLVEVRNGLGPLDSLVVRGAEALRDGASVKIVPPGSARPEARTTDVAPGTNTAGRP